MGCIRLDILNNWYQKPELTGVLSKNYLTLEKTKKKARRAYRFAFNGQEKDDELKGRGNHNTAEFWQYDTRLGRRWNIDPDKFTSISPYVVNVDNPIYFSDPNGDFPPAIWAALAFGCWVIAPTPIENKGTVNPQAEQRAIQKAHNLQGAIVGTGFAFAGGGVYSSALISTATSGSVVNSLVIKASGPIMALASNPKLMEESTALVIGIFTPLGIDNPCPNASSDELAQGLKATVQLAFKDLYGTTRGNFIHGLASWIKTSKGWTDLNKMKSNFKIFDFFNKKTGTLLDYKTSNVSIKDLASELKKLTNVVADAPVVNNVYKYAGIEVKGVKQKALEVVISEETMNAPGAAQIISKAKAEALDKGVQLTVTTTVK